MSDAEVPARERWNARYAAAGFEAFPDAPAGWLVEHRALLADLRPGARTARALDVACGDGRNARWLAQLGFAVDAVDVSDVAIGALRLAAEARELSVDARVLDLEQEALPVGEYDVVVCMHFLQRPVFGSLQAALRPGGVLLYETFTRDHIEVLGSSFNAAFVLERNELLHAFAGLYVRHYREGVIEGGERPRAVASIVAQRLASEG
jgi:2-polyprenyl-3-methyl-5-hydroxy-6-metoxy-1,4-benzoquinol methylase